MMNIEKDFYTRIEEQFGDCKTVAYHLGEVGAIDTRRMEQYLIKDEFKRMRAEGMKIYKIYSILAEKYNKVSDSIKYIVERS